MRKSESLSLGVSIGALALVAFTLSPLIMQAALYIALRWIAQA